MSGFAEPWVSGFDPATGTLALPLWPAAVIAALFVGYCAVVLHSAGRVGIFEAFSRAGLLLVGAAAAWVVPDATAASVAYVVAQLSLLADGSAYERRGGVSYEAALGGLRRAVEIDRYGI